MNKNDQKPGGELKKSLGPVMLWGLGVGYVISGEYFGWNLGLAEGGAYGMLFAFVLITLMYVAFVFSYAELACAIPRAGGVFVYGIRALGPFWGYIGGVAQVVEFVFAPPAIAMAIGAYAGTWLGDVDPRVSAAAAFV
ncbi:MAG: amino acid permease, partial [Pirellulaceae bacterium]|nr:amino acid permease [Pirellulaceae bacterium]